MPTIAAMQGHGIGGEPAFGCYVDFIVLGEECIYSANFMKYGFKPGMGATYMIFKKFRDNLGHELLYTANTYNGGSLKQRGLSLPVMKRGDFYCLGSCKAASRKTAFISAHLTREIQKNLPAIIEAELSMHEQTFAQEEVKERIEALFGA